MSDNVYDEDDDHQSKYASIVPMTAVDTSSHDDQQHDLTYANLTSHEPTVPVTPADTDDDSTSNHDQQQDVTLSEPTSS